MLRRRKDSRACPFDRSRVAARGLRLAACEPRRSTRLHIQCPPCGSQPTTRGITTRTIPNLRLAPRACTGGCVHRVHVRRSVFGVEFTTHDSRLTTHNSQLTTHDSCFMVHSSRSRLTACALRLAACSSQLGTRSSPRTRHVLPRTPVDESPPAHSPDRASTCSQVRKFASSPVRRCEEFSDSRLASPRRIPFAHAPASSLAIRPHPGTPVSPHTPSPRHAASPRRKDRATRCARRRRHGRRGPA